MKIFPLIATALLALALGVVIGRTTQPDDSRGDAQQPGTTAASDRYRSASRSSSGVNNSARVGKIGSKPPTGYDDRVRHMRSLAKQVGGGRSMPNFDALFGVWETAREMSPEELRLALGDLESAGAGQREEMFVKAMLVMQLAKKDGPEAMAYAMEQKGNRRMFPMKEMALQAWANSDPDGAYAWFESNKDQLSPRESRRFLASSIAAMAKKDFATAFSKAKAVDNLSRRDVLRQFGAAVATNAEQRKQFTEYLLTVEDENARSTAAKSMVNELAQTNIKEAIAFVEKWPSDDKSDLTEEVAERWGQTEPEKAMAWRIGKLGADEDAADAVEDVFGDWARRDTAAAKNWLSSQSSDLDKDELRETAARRVMYEEKFPEAVKWADSISDADKRTSSYRSVYRRWSRRDKEGADKWAGTLSPEVRSAVQPSDDDNDFRE